MRIWNKQYGRTELMRYFGTMDNVAGVRRLSFSEGKAKGIEVAEVWTGTGFRFSVLLDKGLDIGTCDFKGIPVALRTPAGEVGPHFYDATGDEWFRSFGGGLLASCGLTYLGAPDVDQGETLGQHGRIHNEPAFEVSTSAEWEDDKYVLQVTGKAREAKTMRGSVLRIRRIKAFAGQNRIMIHDSITNEDFEPTPLMVLYHVNVGHPILDEGALFVADSVEVLPRDEVARVELDTYNIYSGPTQGYPDTVFYHVIRPDTHGFCQASIQNQAFGLGLTVRYSSNTLPRLVQWKHSANGVYGAGIEPSNCLVEGRSVERERGTLQYLQPGETKDYFVELILEEY